MEYKKYFIDSWKELCEKAKNGTFTPCQEQDLVCMMYYLCLKKMGNATLIHSSSTWGRDLRLGKLEGEKEKELIFSNCLLAEFKFITRHRKNRRLEGAKKDILKMSQIAKEDPTVIRIFAIFDKKGNVTISEIEELQNLTDNVTVLFGNLK